jgi:heme exporter protein CcmD
MNHAPYIWSAYGISFLVLLWCALAPVFRKRAFVKTIIQLRENQTTEE